MSDPIDKLRAYLDQCDLQAGADMGVTQARAERLVRLCRLLADFADAYNCSNLGSCPERPCVELRLLYQGIEKELS